MASLNDFYRTWRNRTRRYSRDSLLHAAEHFLDAATAPGIEGLEYKPWITLLAVKWICQDSMLDHGIGRTVSRNEFVQLLNELWNTPFFGYKIEDPHLFFRQLFRPQGGFQRNVTKGHFREAAYIDVLEYDDPLRVLFENKAQLSPAAFIDLSLCVLGRLKKGQATISVNYFRPLYKLHHEETVRNYFALVSRDDSELLEFCRSLQREKRRVASEYFEFPALSRYPFRRRGDAIRRWHPELVYRGIEGMVHSILCEAGQNYMDRFGKIFERYIADQLQKLDVLYHDESVLRDWLGQESSVPDFLLEYPGCNVFIEAKAGMFDESVMTVGSSEIFPHKLRAIRRAVRQGWGAVLNLRGSARAPSSVRLSACNYLLIVTNKDLGVSSGKRLAEMAYPGSFTPDNPAALEVLPLDQIYVLSIDDFERLIRAPSTASIGLPELLAEIIKDDVNQATSRLTFHQHLDHYKIPLAFSELLNDAFDRAQSRVEVALDS